MATDEQALDPAADQALDHSATASAGLQVINLSVGYGRKVVVEGISFALQEGRIAALLGLNSAGKTTTLKTLAGLLKPVSGSIQLNGMNITGRAAAENVRAGLALVPEGARSFADLSVRENLEMGGFILTDRKTIAQRMDEVLSFFPRLKERWTQNAGVLSGGERQMLAIGRALMLRPRILLLDEPFLGLAPIMIQEVTRRLEDLVKLTDCGLLIAEQHVAAALRLCNQAFRVTDRTLMEIPPTFQGGFDERQVSAMVFGTDSGPGAHSTLNPAP